MINIEYNDYLNKKNNTSSYYIKELVNHCIDLLKNNQLTEKALVNELIENDGFDAENKAEIFRQLIANKAISMDTLREQLDARNDALDNEDEVAIHIEGYNANEFLLYLPAKLKADFFSKPSNIPLTEAYANNQTIKNELFKELLKNFSTKTPEEMAAAISGLNPINDAISLLTTKTGSLSKTEYYHTAKGQQVLQILCQLEDFKAAIFMLSSATIHNILKTNPQFHQNLSAAQSESYTTFLAKKTSAEITDGLINIPGLLAQRDDAAKLLAKLSTKDLYRLVQAHELVYTQLSNQQKIVILNHAQQQTDGINNITAWLRADSLDKTIKLLTTETGGLSNIAYYKTPQGQTVFKEIFKNNKFNFQGKGEALFDFKNVASLIKTDANFYKELSDYYKDKFYDQLLQQASTKIYNLLTANNCGLFNKLDIRKIDSLSDKLKIALVLHIIKNKEEPAFKKALEVINAQKYYKIDIICNAIIADQKIYVSFIKNLSDKLSEENPTINLGEIKRLSDQVKIALVLNLIRSEKAAATQIAVGIMNVQDRLEKSNILKAIIADKKSFPIFSKNLSAADLAEYIGKIDRPKNEGYHAHLKLLSNDKALAILALLQLKKGLEENLVEKLLDKKFKTYPEKKQLLDEWIKNGTIVKSSTPAEQTIITTLLAGLSPKDQVKYIAGHSTNTDVRKQGTDRSLLFDIIIKNKPAAEPSLLIELDKQGLLAAYLSRYNYQYARAATKESYEKGLANLLADKTLPPALAQSIFKKLDRSPELETAAIVAMHNAVKTKNLLTNSSTALLLKSLDTEKQNTLFQQLAIKEIVIEVSKLKNVTDFKHSNQAALIFASHHFSENRAEILANYYNSLTDKNDAQKQIAVAEVIDLLNATQIFYVLTNAAIAGNTNLKDSIGNFLANDEDLIKEVLNNENLDIKERKKFFNIIYKCTSADNKAYEALTADGTSNQADFFSAMLREGKNIILADLIASASSDEDEQQKDRKFSLAYEFFLKLTPLEQKNLDQNDTKTLLKNASKQQVSRLFNSNINLIHLTPIFNDFLASTGKNDIEKCAAIIEKANQPAVIKKLFNKIFQELISDNKPAKKGEDHGKAKTNNERTADRQKIIALCTHGKQLAKCLDEKSKLQLNALIDTLKDQFALKKEVQAMKTFLNPANAVSVTSAHTTAYRPRI